MTLRASDVSPPKGAAVCILAVDTSYGVGGQLQWIYRPHKTVSVARIFAYRDVRRMYAEGYVSHIRGVFIQHEDGEWETIGSYFDVGARRKYQEIQDREDSDAESDDTESDDDG
jgi:hypothetical protein